MRVWPTRTKVALAPDQDRSTDPRTGAAKRWRFGVKTEHWPWNSASCSRNRRRRSGGDGNRAGAVVHAIRQAEGPGQTPAAAGSSAAHRNSPRTRLDHLCTCGLPSYAHRRGCAEKLDYTPGSFTVERHIRGKWVCQSCETLIQAPVPAQVIDKGMPTSGLLTQVLIGKYLDHLPLYRQERIFERAGVAIPRSTLAQWVGQCGVALQPLVDALKQEMLTYPVLHADETPVALLNPGSGKTDRAYLWALQHRCPPSRQSRGL